MTGNVRMRFFSLESSSDYYKSERLTARILFAYVFDSCGHTSAVDINYSKYIAM